MKTPPLIAHRGYPLHYPENTLEGIEAALQVGAQFVEFDIQLTADGVAIVCHDDNLQRTSGINAPVTEMTLQQLQLIPVGEPSRFTDRYADITSATLTEVVDMLSAWPAATAFVELKVESCQAFGVEAVVDTVMDCLHPILTRSVIISDVAEAVSCVRDSGVFSSGWIMHEWNERAHDIAKDLVPDYLLCNHTRIPREPEPLWSGPWRWALYETSDANMAVELAELGADLVETNAIGEMLRQLGHGELAVE